MFMPATQGQETIGEYVIEAELGRGAHGVVYRGHHQDRPDTPVALKVIENRGDKDRLLLEPAVLSRLRHPGIVGIEDYFVVGDDLVLALEFIEGKDLNTLLNQGQTFTVDEVRDLLIQMAAALVEAHAKNVMHRDIKPANILVTQTEGRTRYVLTDFGIGQMAEGIQSQKHAGGTYLFMAPEQLRGRPAPQSDLWALGVVAYRLLTGFFPFPGPSLAELSRQILYQTPAAPSQLCPQPIDPQLERTVSRLLDKSLQERVASAEELLGSLGHRPRASSTPLQKQPIRRKPRAQSSLDEQIRRGMTWRWALIVVCLLMYLLYGGMLSGLALVGGLVLFYHGQTQDQSTARTVVRTLLSFIFLGTYVDLLYFHRNLDYVPQLQLLVLLNSFPIPEVGLVVFTFVPLLISYGIPVFTCSLFVGVRRLHREKLLRDSAMKDHLHSEEDLEALRRSLDTRFEDVGFHLKYAEALYARGRVKESAVEARLLLRQDPYHFNGNLLLANAYFQLDLLQDCIELCEGYLQVSGYCFEFNELRDQCQRRLQP